jgi:nickel transport system substrate-binding protein
VKKLFSFPIAILLTLSMAACGSKNDPAVPSSGESAVKTLTFCESWDFQSGFYPIGSPETQTNYGALYWGANFYETLVNYEDGAYTPGLAESWHISDDGTVYTFKLRSGVKFSDGTALTSAAVKKSFEAAPVNLGMYNGSYGALTLYFKEFVCPDEHTIEMRLTQPYYGTLKDLCGLVPLAIVNPNALGDDLKPLDTFITATHGTGPYQYDSTADSGDGTSYTFVRNPYYDRAMPALDSFIVKVIPDNNAKLLALKSGEIDAILGADMLSVDGYLEMKSAQGFGAALSDSSANTRIIGVNLKHTGFEDIAVRSAMAMAIDKDTICASVLSGIETRADTLFPRSYPFCDVDVTPRDYDLEAAKQVLESASWSDADGDGIREKEGVKLSGTMIYITGSAAADDLALTIAAQVREAGICHCTCDDVRGGLENGTRGLCDRDTRSDTRRLHDG